MKQNIYDNEKFFNEYQSMRKQEINANELLEKPTIRKILPNLKGKRILDLGCGAGEFCRYVLDNGAEFVVGTDISQNMIGQAKKLENEKIKFKLLAMEDITTLNQTFDVVVSSLAFHYVKDFDKLIKDINSCLTDGGQLVFSQEHPIGTSFIPVNKNLEKKIYIDGKIYYLVSDYNNSGKRISNWNVDGVIKYHRSFSELINTLIKNGFKIDEIVENTYSEDVVKKAPKYKNQLDKPYFIFIKATKIK